MTRLREWALIGLFVVLALVATTLGLMRVHYNMSEIQTGQRLDRARKALAEAERDQVRLGLVRSWLRQPTELRERARREAGLEGVSPQDIVPVEPPATEIRP